MKIIINKEDYEKYDKLEIILKQSKNPIVINGEIKELVSNEKEFFVKTSLEQFKTYAKNIEAIHFKSQITNDIAKTIKEISEALDL